MKDRRGQALVEFILIIPVLMFIILASIDVGNIIVSKYKLEEQTSTIVNLYENNSLSELDSYAKKNNLNISYTNSENYININVSKKIHIITPGLNNIIGKNMKIETDRIIYNE